MLAIKVREFLVNVEEITVTQKIDEMIHNAPPEQPAEMVAVPRLAIEFKNGRSFVIQFESADERDAAEKQIFICMRRLHCEQDSVKQIA